MIDSEHVNLETAYFESPMTYAKKTGISLNNFLGNASLFISAIDMEIKNL